MPVLSMWIGFEDPQPRIWLQNCLQNLKWLKETGDQLTVSN